LTSSAVHLTIDKAMEDLMKRFDDPYSRHIPRSMMTIRHRGIRGEAVGVGMVLRRKFYLRKVKSAIKGLFFKTTNRFKSTDRDTDRESDRESDSENARDIDRRTSASSSPATATSTEKIVINLLDSQKNFIYQTEDKPAWKQQYDSVLTYVQHLLVSVNTVVPFIVAASCHHLTTREVNIFPWNLYAIKVRNPNHNSYPSPTSTSNSICNP
jgi:hypothetical protein